MGLWLAVAAGGLIAWWLLWRRSFDRAAAVTLAVSLAASGGAWHHQRWHYFSADDIGLFAREKAEPVCVEAVAVTGPRLVPAPAYDPLRSLRPTDQTRLAIRLVGIRDGSHWLSASGGAQLSMIGKPTNIHAGDRLRILGHLSAPWPASNPGEIDYAELARGRGQLAAVYVNHPEGIEILRPASGWSLGEFVESVRSRGDKLLWDNLSHERAGLAAAVLLGAREELDPHRVEPFMLTGTIHVMVVAGLHVGVLAFLLFQALRIGWVPRRTALVAVAGVTGLYALVTDAEPPVLRATILVWIVCVSLWLGRGRLAMNSLALAGLVIVALNPTELFRAGTQLSFLAVAGLIALGPLARRHEPLDPLARLIAQSRPWLTRMLHRVRHELFQAGFVGLIIWLVTAPLVMAHFHLISPAAILLMPVLVLPMTLAMISGFGVLLFGAWLPPVTKLCAILCDQNLALLEWIVAKTAAWRWSHQWVAGPRDWWLCGIYLILGAIIFIPGIAPSRSLRGQSMPPPLSRLQSIIGWVGQWRWPLALLSSWCAVGLGVAWLRPIRSDGLDCTFVSVGHGCAVVVELPDGRVLLSDAGRLGSPYVGAREISSCLWSRGLTHIDAIVLSHNDIDHLNAVPELLERFSVGVVYVSPVMFNRETNALKALKQAIGRARVPLREISVGQHLASGDDTCIDVLHPPPDGMGETENADSICLAIVWRGRRILLTGDLAPPGLETVVAERSEPFDVIMVPHHGSAASLPPVFAAWCRAHWAVISGDLTHDSHVAVKAYRDAGSIVLNTATSGAVHFYLPPDGGPIRMDCYRRGERW
jgi:competence protein ComEC